MKVLAGSELPRMPLIVAHTTVVEAAVARDVVERALAGHASGAFADDDGELAFEVELLGLARREQRLPVPHDAVAEADENHGTLGALAAHLLDVRHVVDANAEQLRSSVRNDRREGDVVDTEIGCAAREPLELAQAEARERFPQAIRLAGEPGRYVDDTVANDDAEPGPALSLETCKSHR